MPISQNIIDELKNQGIKPDSSQIILIDNLCSIEFNKKSIFNLRIKKNIKKSGIYIWGDVGRGKTLITQTFIKSCTNIVTKSFHYIDLMKFIHKKLSEYSGKKNPLINVKKALYKDCQLLFIDEFQVEDVADAMIIGNLISELIHDGLNIIITSNAHPNDLYKDGLQRKKFLDSMEILKQKLKIFELDAGTDYRTKKIMEFNADAKNYSDNDIRELISGNVDAEKFLSSKLAVNNRDFECKLAINNLLWIEFSNFFRQATGTDDYIFICDRYDWIFISDFMECDDDSLDIIRRFISFVDIAYKEKSKVRFFFNSHDISKTYSGEKLGIIWDRCESRLKEMISFHHLS